LTVCVSCFTASHAWLGDSGMDPTLYMLENMF
jgi:hypothetical protein